MSEGELANAATWAHIWSEIERWAFMAVVIALIIEFAALKFGAPYREKIEAARESQLSTLRIEAARLSVEAETARASVAEANTKATEASREADEANARAAQAEARAAEALRIVPKGQEPHPLSDEQQSTIIALLQEFKGQKVAVLQLPPRDLSTATIVDQLIQILTGAEWEFYVTQPDATSVPASPGGVFVREIATYQRSYAGEALAMALTGNGISTGYSRTVIDKSGIGVGEDITLGVIIFVSPRPPEAAFR